MLSIIIVNWKNPALLRLSLSSLARALTDEAFLHEIIVVDVEAGTETGNLVREEFPAARYLPFSKNIGYTRGVNEGLAAAKGDEIFIMNADIIPLRGSLEALSAYMKAHPEIGILGPQLFNFDGTPQQSCFRFYTPLTIVCRRTFIGKLPFIKKIQRRFLLKDKDLSRPLPVDWLMGSAYLVSRAALAKVGPMDERFYLYFSDVDWPRRFWENGYQVVFYPEARMYHYHHRESRGAADIFDAIINSLTQQHIRDGIRYFWKHGLWEHSYIA